MSSCVLDFIRCGAPRPGPLCRVLTCWLTVPRFPRCLVLLASELLFLGPLWEYSEARTGGGLTFPSAGHLQALPVWGSYKVDSLFDVLWTIHVFCRVALWLQIASGGQQRRRFFLPRSTPISWTGDFLGGPGAYFLPVLSASLYALGRRPASTEGGFQADARRGILGGPGPSCPLPPVPPRGREESVL